MRRWLQVLKQRVREFLPRRYQPALAPNRVRRRASGLTLVEMLVTLAITLVMMAAVVNIFASVGSSVRVRRATIEMSNQMRIARNLLQRDLSQATAVTLPPLSPQSNQGYLEIIEGAHTDARASGLTEDVSGPNDVDGSITLGESLVPPAANPQELPVAVPSPQNAAVPNTLMTSLGDYDDIVALTVRSRDEPYRGRAMQSTLESKEAEVIWYSVENPRRILGEDIGPNDPRYLGEPGMRTVYRRVLLVKPNISLPPPLGEGLQLPAATGEWASPTHFYRYYDISARIEDGRWVANSLADLTKRENRFGRFPVFPFLPDVRLIRFADSPTNLPVEQVPALHPYGINPQFGGPLLTQDPLMARLGNRTGEDVVLSNVLAFDVRVFDPLAPLYFLPSGGTVPQQIPSPLADGTVLSPGDPGWELAYATDTGGNSVPDQYVARGAYVDLSFVGPLPNGPLVQPWDTPVGQATSTFSMGSHAKAGLAFFLGQANYPQIMGIPLGIRSYWDTWSHHYESDGKPQFPFGSALGFTNQPHPVVDPGIDGIDQRYLNQNQSLPGYGVDDASERETSPPFNSPLRGMQVRLRVYEPDSRALREVSVQQNFVPY